MSNVTLDISGHGFTIACAEGEEDHVQQLGRMISDKLAQMPNASAQSESRMLLFASLLLADELHEVRHRGNTREAIPPGLADRLEQLAGQFENIAALLERQPASH